ncbi:MAG TPA: anhydro-N-acetylmuramic acid kinase [Tepidisphaeraceae bacterium]|nr:anhydro-N-acetylmuramic acid kinase [Tepidisphaeraceae bacterium]
MSSGIIVAPMNRRLLIGAMSGTSADGVDAALVRIGGRGLDMSAELLSQAHQPYDDQLRDAIFAMRASGEAPLADLARLGQSITLAYARAVKELLAAAHIAPPAISAIAAHGQTLFHRPPLTIQWLDPSLLAWETKCPVVSDFRRADCAAGGQGAPLVPFADYILFRHATRERVLLNIGGIANLTVISPATGIEQIVAFDTGPGNCISDSICRTYGPFGLSWDVDGQRAGRGRVVQEVVERFMRQSFLAIAGPKSTDTPAMIRAFEQAIAGTTIAMDDLLATAAYITAACIAKAIDGKAVARERDLIVSGGGLHNKAIMGWLRSLLGPETLIRSTDDFAVAASAKEAVAFALLGAATLDGLPSNVPSVTGARQAVILGSITPRPAISIETNADRNA